MEAHAPDVAGVIEAWKALEVVWLCDTEEPRLGSPRRSQVWEVGAPTRAVCQRVREAEVKGLYVTISRDGTETEMVEIVNHGPVPAEEPASCKCGIHAVRNPSRALPYMHSTHPTAGQAVLAKIGLYGRVIPAEHGYRAECAYPIALVRHGPIADELLERVAGVYGIPVEPAPAGLSSVADEVYVMTKVVSDELIAAFRRAEDKAFILGTAMRDASASFRGFSLGFDAAYWPARYLPNAKKPAPGPRRRKNRRLLSLRRLEQRRAEARRLNPRILPRMPLSVSVINGVTSF